MPELEQARRLVGLTREYSRLVPPHGEWCAKTLQIRDKQGRTVPFVHAPAQVKLDETIAAIRAREPRRPVRIVFLKARQVYVSTGTAGHFFQGVALHPGQKATVVAHDEQSAKDIFGYYTQFDDSYKPRPGDEDKLATERDARVTGILSYKGGGYIRVQSANNVTKGRGGSQRYLHLSEYAFWRDAKTLMTGLMQTVPDDPDTMVIVESTPNGKGGPFYDLCMEAMDPSGKSDWVFVFFAWWEHPEYAKPLYDKVSFEKSITAEEYDLRRLYHLTLEQLHWRRWAIKNKCQGSADIFAQEFASNPLECFLLSGRARFDARSLSRMQVDPNPSVGEIQEIWNGPKRVIAFLPGPGGALAVYRKPSPNKEYVIGIDVAEGIDINDGKGTADPDWTVMYVCDRDTGEQVAQFRARIEPAAAGDYLCLLGEWYNWAFLVPEANGPGGSVIETLMRAGYPPALIFHRRPLPDESQTSDAANKLQYLGWKQSTVTRPQLISTHDMAIRELGIVIRDPVCLDEHQTFVTDKNGKATAQVGCHDDAVIACALATIGLQHPPPDRRMLGMVRPQPLSPPRPNFPAQYYKRPGRGAPREEARGVLVRI